MDSVQDAQALLAVYPMASATPTHHGSIVDDFHGQFY